MIKKRQQQQEKKNKINGKFKERKKEQKTHQLPLFSARGNDGATPKEIHRDKRTKKIQILSGEIKDRKPNGNQAFGVENGIWRVVQDSKGWVRGG